MPLRISLLFLATLLFVSVLAALSMPANAYATPPEQDGGINATDLLSTGPLNVVTYRVSAR